MNVLVDHDREAFMKNLTVFVDQVKDVDFINLFITSLGYVVLPIQLRSFSPYPS